MPIVCLAVTILGNAGRVFGDAVLTKQRSIAQVATGVFVIRHQDAPNGIPNGNTEVIIGDREVLVVDSCYLASAARQDIAQIRQRTDKPVRYLVNTHWHNDHTMGNGTYSDAFPSLLIISHTETKTMMEGYLSAWFARHSKQIARLKQESATGKGDDGTPLTEAQVVEARKDLSGEDQVVAEFPNFIPRLPDLTFEHELDLDLGNRLVQVKFLGRGNTAGDAVVFLPKEGILISGDIVVHPVPYLCSGYPSEWVETLQRLIDLNPQTIVPGHGEVLHQTRYLTEVQRLLTTVVGQVRHALYVQGNGAPLEDVQKAVQQAVDFNALRRQV